MKNNRLILFVMAAAALFMNPLQTGAEESPAGVKVGMLTCMTLPHSGFTLLIHSTTDVKCQFKASGSDVIEHYIGETGIGLGIDMRYDRVTQLAYTVVAVEHKGSYKLAGKYVGGGASVTAVAGVGAQVLFGGGPDSISLQPVLEGSTGLGISAGITYLFLQPDREDPKDKM